MCLCACQVRWSNFFWSKIWRSIKVLQIFDQELVTNMVLFYLKRILCLNNFGKVEQQQTFLNRSYSLLSKLNDLRSKEICSNCSVKMYVKQQQTFLNRSLHYKFSFFSKYNIFRTNVFDHTQYLVKKCRADVLESFSGRFWIGSCPQQAPASHLLRPQLLDRPRLADVSTSDFRLVRRKINKNFETTLLKETSTQK